MKKINLFNKTISPLSDGKGCPVERGGVWELPRRTPCATPSWKEGERKVPSYRRMPVSRGFNRGGGIPLFSGMTAVIFALFVATPSFAEPTELDKKTVASKAYVDTKQDQITTGLVTFHDPDDGTDYTVPALVSYGTGTNNGDGVLGNKIGILGVNVNGGGLNSWEFLDLWDDSESAYLDNFVPTVRAVADALQRIKWTKINWNNATHPSAINAYSVTFGTASTNWPSANRTELVNGYTFAEALALKQNKLDAKASNARAQAVTRSSAGSTASAYITAGGSVGLTTRSGAPAIIGYVNGTAVTDSTAMTTFTTGTFGSNNTINQNYIKNALVSLELLKDVYSELNAKITNNALPTGTTGTVVTYNGTNATTGVQEFGERAVYDPANAYNAQNDATKLATMASVKYECAGYEAGHENDPDYCWLWALPN